MSRDILVSASILCANFACLGEEIRKCEQSGVNLIHVDVMDGHFVPNITIGPVVVAAIRPLTKLKIEAHLMVKNPGDFIEPFAQAGADIIAVHAECYGVLKEGCRRQGQFPKELQSFSAPKALADIRKIRKLGKQAFLVLNPGTPLCIQPVLPELDGVLIMSVNPGFAKQKFMPVALAKIQDLRRQFAGDIAVDGGINAETAPEAVKAGANVLATASYFFGASKPKEAVSFLKGLKSLSS